jgi:hypothetical protein
MRSRATRSRAPRARFDSPGRPGRMAALTPGLAILVWTCAAAVPVFAAETPLVGRFHRAATECRLVRQGQTGALAGFADTAWVNAEATIWTFSLEPAAPLSAREIAERLAHARKTDMGRLLFRHVQGWLDSPAGSLPPGILPLGARQIRFLLERPDPGFPSRLAEVEASLCADPRSPSDFGCGPFRIAMRLGPDESALARPGAIAERISCWRLSEAAGAGNGSGPLLELVGQLDRTGGGTSMVRLGFQLPQLPGYCAVDEQPPAANSPLLAHVFLLVGARLRGEREQIQAALMSAPLMPGSAAWVQTSHLLPGPSRAGAAAESLGGGEAPDRETARESAGAVAPTEERRQAILAYPEGLPAMHCIAERVRALLWPAGWDLLLQPLVEGESSAAESTAADLILGLEVTSKRAEAWDHLRLLFALAPPEEAAQAGGLGRAPGSASLPPLLEEEWEIAAALEVRLLSRGDLIPLLTARVEWWLEAPERPDELIDGVLPFWRELSQPLVVITGEPGHPFDRGKGSP